MGAIECIFCVSRCTEHGWVWSDCNWSRARDEYWLLLNCIFTSVRARMRRDNRATDYSIFGAFGLVYLLHSASHLLSFLRVCHRVRRVEEGIWSIQVLSASIHYRDSPFHLSPSLSCWYYSSLLEAVSIILFSWSLFELIAIGNGLAALLGKRETNRGPILLDCLYRENSLSFRFCWFYTNASELSSTFYLSFRENSCGTTSIKARSEVGWYNHSTRFRFVEFLLYRYQDINFFLVCLTAFGWNQSSLFRIFPQLFDISIVNAKNTHF